METTEKVGNIIAKVPMDCCHRSRRRSYFVRPVNVLGTYDDDPSPEISILDTFAEDLQFLIAKNRDWHDAVKQPFFCNFL